MKAERLFRVLGIVDPALVEEAYGVRRQPWRRWAALAACLAVVVGAGFGWMATGGFRGYGSGMSGGSSPIGGMTGAPSSDAGDGGVTGTPSSDTGDGGMAGGVEGGIIFMSYGGPVLPLTTAESAPGLTAERTVTWDFAPRTNRHGETRQWGAEVTDRCVLRNGTDADVTVTALYPFAGRFSELGTLQPSVAVDGETVEPALVAGAYSGGFQSTFGAEIPDTMNLDTLNSWEEYRVLLEDGRYLEQALGPYPTLDVPVTVYEFSGFAAPLEEYPAATQAVSFDIDEDATKILTYGFNGAEWDEGFRRYSYFVPDGRRREPDYKVLVVLGEDIGDYTLEGYRNGGCDPGEEIEGVSCTVTRSETTLDALLERLCRYYAEWYSNGRAADQENVFDEISFEMYQGAVAQLLEQYGTLSIAPMDRYKDGRLDDILSETLSHSRVLYLSFPVTVPAGGSAAVDCTLWKEPSFDYGCSGSENEGLQGYDMVTTLGSSLEFTSQRAALVNAGGVTVTGGNFGFALENGAAGAELDLEREHYYLEVRPKEES